MDTRKQKQSDGQSASSVRDRTSAALPQGEDRDTLISYYHQMLLIRHFEEKTGEMYTRARIGGYCHLNLYAIGRGIPPKAVMAELFGKETGVSRGRGGSMHLFDLERHFMGGYAIVGGQLPLATGAGFAIAYRGSSEIVACQMGDGTTNAGTFHESLNLARIYNLPVVYFVVNNLYGMGLRVEQGSAVSELYRKACAYNMQSWRVDGNDVLAVRDAVRKAAELARDQHEPSLLEAVSYRFRGHSVVDPDRYRDKEEVQHGRDEDPVRAFASRLLAAGVLDEQSLQEIDAQVQREVDEAVKFADESPDPPVEQFMQGLEEYVYAPDTAEQKGN
ncbi:MAG: pyruvate dehydrogenase (acetyl-transferring) E1 component subunit alpha [Chloroflexi bacterium]|nr:MAG: pyruvate dehydrogenase (acetyl-transferring) E1 component subunit alpha [Chloroflexota bacterium]